MAKKAKLQVTETDTDESTVTVQQLHENITAGLRSLTPTQGVLLEVEAERQAQDERWGEQNHPLIGGASPLKGLAHYRREATKWRNISDSRNAQGRVGWDAVLLEECYEVFAESDYDRAREELIQVAAVAVAAVESIDRMGEKEAA